MKSDVIPNEFNQYLKTQCDTGSNKRVVLALSGGIDSMVMADLFIRLKQTIVIAHCNFGLRGKESEEDQRFVQEYAQSNGIGFYVKNFDVHAFMKEHRVSVQMAAREMRYLWFEELRAQLDFDAIATAHHKNDVLETFLINFIRGSGISGLHGIQPIHGRIIRPILFLSKLEIMDYAVENSIAYRNDSSNLKNDYKRNFVRNEIIPLFKNIHPEIEQTANETILKLRETEIIFNKSIQKIKDKVYIRKDGNVYLSLNTLREINQEYKDALNTLYFELFNPFGFTASACRDIRTSVDSQSGLHFYSDTHRLLRDRDFLIIKPLNDDEDSDSEYSISETEKTYENKNFILNFEKKNLHFEKITKLPHYAYLDFDRLKFPLRLRNWRKGDSFHPSGIGNRKKISDFLTENKLSLYDKEQVMVLISGQDIVWVAGMRIDERYRFKKETGEAFIITYKNKQTENEQS